MSRIASGELDKLALRHAIDEGPVTAEDVRALVAETTPASVWALSDAVGERRVDVAATALERLLESTPEPVLLAVLHRRVVELLELGDRVASGAKLPDAARAMGIASEYRAKTLAAQARKWTTDELTAALRGLVELDAMVKGAPGFETDVAQRRLAFLLWVRQHTGEIGLARRSRLTPGPVPRLRPSVGGRPGLFLDDEVALDREDATAFGEVEQLDQIRIDVELRAVLAEPTRDAEAQPLAPVGQPERRVEPGRDEPVTAGWAAIARSGHGRMLHARSRAHHDPTVPHPPVRVTG